MSDNRLRRNHRAWLLRLRKSLEYLSVLNDSNFMSWRHKVGERCIGNRDITWLDAIALADDEELGYLDEIRCEYRRAK